MVSLTVADQGHTSAAIGHVIKGYAVAGPKCVGVSENPLHIMISAHGIDLKALEPNHWACIA